VLSAIVSFGMGYQAYAIMGSIAAGPYATAVFAGTSIGFRAQGNYGAIAVGYSAESDAAGIAVGSGTYAQVAAVAVGEDAYAGALHAIAIGLDAEAGAENAIAIGTDAEASYASNDIAIGYGAATDGTYATHIGTAAYNVKVDRAGVFSMMDWKIRRDPAVQVWDESTHKLSIDLNGATYYVMLHT
jgi:hypothetical protein